MRLTFAVHREGSPFSRGFHGMDYHFRFGDKARQYITPCPDAQAYDNETIHLFRKTESHRLRNRPIYFAHCSSLAFEFLSTGRGMFIRRL